MTYYIKNILSEKLPSASIYNLNSGGTLNNYYNNISNLVNNFNVKKIYLINNINNTKNDKLKKFDAYIIDYIKQLDENDNVSLILVEYKKEALNSSGAPLKDNKGNIMYETYISSLEW